MDFRLFGPFEVWHEGASVDPGDLQQRYVLVILLLNANRAIVTAIPGTTRDLITERTPYCRIRYAF